MNYFQLIFTIFFALIIQPSFSQQLVEQINVLELFSVRVEPRIFNWTFQGLTEQFQYRSSLENYPDLPSWIRYMYSNEYHAGFLYGTPPEKLAEKDVNIEIIALNKQNYETRRVLLTLQINNKVPPTNVIQMKIDNLNWVHMMDPGRVENLKNIFRNDLWPESKNDLHVTFMDSAVKMGSRMPLRPNAREGVIVHLGSNAEFSQRLLELQKEVKPLYKISTCTYKRTSVQTIFENSGFTGLDWCAFKFYGEENSPDSLKNAKESSLSTLRRTDQWETFSKDEIPERNYSDEFALSFAIPGLLLAILVSTLTVILCFQHEKLRDDDSEYYFNFIFYVCTDFLRLKKSYRHDPKMSQSVQMVQYSSVRNQPTTILKSLKDIPSSYDDNLSLRSQSPSDSYYREGSPHIGNNYLRPKPPPYKPTSNSNSSTMNRKGVEI
uniref:Putative sarcoglycan alpha n=1 Tax=Corethrella appendiculata TaxID=1370023 RepID=U5EQX6_9DIPT